MPRKTSIYLSDDLAEAVRASGKSIPDLIRAGLAAGEAERGGRLAAEVEKLVSAAGKLTAALRDGYRIVPRDPGTE